MIECGRKPYLASNYVDMMKDYTDKRADNEYVIVQSVLKKPYTTNNYQEMEYAPLTIPGTTFDWTSGWDFLAMYKENLEKIKSQFPIHYTPETNYTTKTKKTVFNKKQDEKEKTKPTMVWWAYGSYLNPSTPFAGGRRYSNSWVRLVPRVNITYPDRYVDMWTYDAKNYFIISLWPLSGSPPNLYYSGSSGGVYYGYYVMINGVWTPEYGPALAWSPLILAVILL